MTLLPKLVLLVLFILLLQANCQRPSHTDYCPNDCTSKRNGHCSKSLRCCECKTGFFGPDCSQNISLLADKSNQKLSIAPASISYFSLNILDSLQSLTLKFKALPEENSLEYYILLANPDEKVLPDQMKQRALKLVSSNSTSQAVTFGDKKLDLFEGGLLLIGVRNLCNHTETVKLKIKKKLITIPSETTEATESSNVLTFVLWAIAIVVGCITVARIFGWQLVEDEFGTFHLTPIKAPAIPAKKDLDSLFPIKKYEDFQVHFEQTSCSICLLNYEPHDPCRSFNCEHIFHNECIELWLVKNDFCPNCKTDIQTQGKSKS